MKLLLLAWHLPFLVGEEVDVELAEGGVNCHVVVPTPIRIRTPLQIIITLAPL